MDVLEVPEPSAGVEVPSLVAVGAVTGPENGWFVLTMVSLGVPEGAARSHASK